MATETIANANQNQPYNGWIHCNHCYEVFIKKQRKFFLLACEDIACQICLTEEQQDINGPKLYKCCVCFKTTRGAEIGNTMAKNLKELFHPEPYMDGLNHFQIIKFQYSHRNRYFKYLERHQNTITEEWRTVSKCKEVCKKTFYSQQERKIDRRKVMRRALEIKKQVEENDNNPDQEPLSFSSSSSSATSSAAKLMRSQSSPKSKSSSIKTFAELNPKTSFVL